MSTTVRTQHPAESIEEPRPEHGHADPLIMAEQSEGVLVLRPLGGLDRSVVDRLRRAVAETTSPVIVDLDDCVLIEPTCLMRIIAHSRRPRDAGVSIVCRRLSCRRLLARVGIAERFAVFARLEDALVSLGRGGTAGAHAG